VPFPVKEEKKGMRRGWWYVQVQIIVLDSTSKQVCSMVGWLVVFLTDTYKFVEKTWTFDNQQKRRVDEFEHNQREYVWNLSGNSFPLGFRYSSRSSRNRKSNDLSIWISLIRLSKWNSTTDVDLPTQWKKTLATFKHADSTHFSTVIHLLLVILDECSLRIVMIDTTDKRASNSSVHNSERYSKHDRRRDIKSAAWYGWGRGIHSKHSWWWERLDDENDLMKTTRWEMLDEKDLMMKILMMRRTW
jgi:hypothetical protein